MSFGLSLAMPYSLEGEFTADQLEFRYSGSGTGTSPQLSLGGTITPSGIPLDTVNSVFDDVTTAETTAGDVEYRCVFVKSNSTAIWQNVVAWISATPGQGGFAIGVDTAGPGTATVSSSADEGIAPSPAVTFGTPTSKAAGTALGDLPSGTYRAIWLRRTIPTGGTADPFAAVSIRVEGDTST